MARHAPNNKATSAVNRTAVFKVSTAWDVAGDASEHAAMMVRRRWCARGKSNPVATVLTVPKQVLRWVRDGDAGASVLLSAPDSRWDSARAWMQGTVVHGTWKCLRGRGHIGAASGGAACASAEMGNRQPADEGSVLCQCLPQFHGFGGDSLVEPAASGRQEEGAGG